MSSLPASQLRSYTTAVQLDDALSAALERYARLFSRAVRWAYAQRERHIRCGLPEQSKAERKQAVVSRFGLTSRQANAVLMEADGKRDAQLALDKRLLDALTRTLRKKQRQLRDCTEALGQHKVGLVRRLSSDKASRLRRRVYGLQTDLSRLSARHAVLQDRLKQGLTSLAFGSKKLLRERSALTQAADIASWHKRWQLAREGQFLVLGSKDETGGCQGCVASLAADGSVSLRVRLPDALGGEFVTVTGVRWHYGAERLRYALAQQAVRAQSLAVQRTKTQGAKFSQRDVEGGAAITWRFMHQGDGLWRVVFTTAMEPVAVRTQVQLGAVGVDFNAGFVTVAQADRFGNLLEARNLRTPTVGLSAGQRTAALAEAVKAVVAQCRETGKPLVLEELDFAKKKKSEALTGRHRRVLSAMAYAEFKRLCLARAHDAGVEVLFVDPSYTSTQGLVRYVAQRGWSVHQAAAGVIARRGMGLAERAPVCGTLRVPLADAAVEWPIPEDVGRSDVRQRWPMLHRGLRGAIASHFRRRRGAALTRPGPAPLRSAGSPGRDSQARSALDAHLSG